MLMSMDRMTTMQNFFARRDGYNLAEQAKEKGHLCGAFQKILCPSQCTLALLLMDNVDEVHQGHTNLGHSVPQAQIYHQPGHHTRWHSHSSSRKVGRHSQRLHATPPHQLECIGTILKNERTRPVQPNTPRLPLNLPPTPNRTHPT